MTLKEGSWHQDRRRWLIHQVQIHSPDLNPGLPNPRHSPRRFACKTDEGRICGAASRLFQVDGTRICRSAIPPSAAMPGHATPAVLAGALSSTAIRSAPRGMTRWPPASLLRSARQEGRAKGTGGSRRIPCAERRAAGKPRAALPHSRRGREARSSHLTQKPYPPRVPLPAPSFALEAEFSLPAQNPR